MKGKKLLKRLGAILGGLLLAALVLEGVVLLVFGERAKFPRRVVGADFGIRINEPGATYRHKSADVNVEFRINSRGLREDREIPYEKPTGEYRILSLGDSFTIGYEVDVEDTFSNVIERELSTPERTVEVINAGVSGTSNAEQCIYLERELHKYDPDIVLVTFFTNDLVDNVRTGLFGFEGERLVPMAESYVPLGGLANFLNTNFFFNYLSERSNAFVMAKEKATLLLKARMVEQNLQHLDAKDARAEGRTTEEDDQEARYRCRLAAAIFDRIYEYCASRNIKVVIGTVPSLRIEPDRLVDMFPIDDFDTEREGLYFLSGKTVLDPLVGNEQLYWLQSHRHWTPLAHREYGRAVAALIEAHGLLDDE